MQASVSHGATARSLCSRETFYARLSAPAPRKEKVGYDGNHDDHDHRYYQSPHCSCHLRFRWVHARIYIRSDLIPRRKLLRPEARRERSGRESPQYIDRIDRNVRKGPMCAGYPRSIPVHIIARKSVLIARNRKYRPQWPPRRNTLICRSFLSPKDIAVDAVGILLSSLYL